MGKGVGSFVLCPSPHRSAQRRDREYAAALDPTATQSAGVPAFPRYRQKPPPRLRSAPARFSSTPALSFLPDATPREGDKAPRGRDKAPRGRDGVPSRKNGRRRGRRATTRKIAKNRAHPTIPPSPPTFRPWHPTDATAKKATLKKEAGKENWIGPKIDLHDRTARMRTRIDIESRRTTPIWTRSTAIAYLSPRPIFSTCRRRESFGRPTSTIDPFRLGYKATASTLCGPRCDIRSTDCRTACTDKEAGIPPDSVPPKNADDRTRRLPRPLRTA
jgi:hypothetical protein